MSVVWITKELTIAIHKRQLAEHGGLDGIRDEGMLESALAKPMHLAAYSETASIVELAAAYAFGLARNHPFLDGNKRSAAVICETFLMLNGLELNASDEEMYQTFIDLASGNLEEKALATWLEANTNKLAT